MFSYALRLGLYLALMLLFGRMLFIRPVLATRWYRALILVSLTLVVADAVTRLSGLLGLPPNSIDTGTVLWFATETPVGLASITRIAALLALLLLCIAEPPISRMRRAAGILLSAAALASLAWNGHAAAGDGLTGDLRLGAGMVHLLAAGAWVGAIASFLQLAVRGSGSSLRHRTYELWNATHRFAWPGTVIVVLLAMTGVYNYVDLGGSQSSLFGTNHGRWLLLKLGIVSVMLLLAALHRWRLVPALAAAIRTGGQLRALRFLRFSLTGDAVLAFLVLVCVAVLGTLDPLT
nr:copper homeostasis membrane protein CopD [Stenotrophomonas sp. SY1]